MKQYIIIGLLIFITSCKKDQPIEPGDNNDNHSICSYEPYSTSDFEKVHKHLISQSPSLPVYFYPDRYLYSDPVFNPCNPYEIAYLRLDTWNASGCDNELWKFSFCTGKAVKLAEHVCYSPDWSSKGWLIFTGVDRQLWKVLDNGDSLTQLTNDPGFNNDAKWSLDGTIYAYTNQNGILSNSCGKKLRTIPINTINWFDNNLIVGSNSSGIVSYNIQTEEIKVLHPAKPGGASQFPFDKNSRFLYYTDFAGFRPVPDDKWIRYNLQNGATDTLKTLYDSYLYGDGDYADSTGKIVTILARSAWKDSTANERYGRAHVIIMNPDGTDERLIQLPE